jgi:hypothetical protein
LDVHKEFRVSFEDFTEKPFVRRRELKSAMVREVSGGEERDISGNEEGREKEGECPYNRNYLHESQQEKARR